MLRWISKSGTFIQVALFAVLLFVLWLPAVVHPIVPISTSHDGPLYFVLFSWILKFPVFSVTFALALIVFQSFVLFYIFQANGFFNRGNFLPAIIVLISYSWNPDFQTMHALLPASIFIMLALHGLMGIFGQHGAYQEMFSVAFFIGIASLFYFPVVYFMLFVWFSLITYRVSSWREYVISIIGVSLPYVYYLSWLFWVDNTEVGLNQIADSLFNFMLPSSLSIINTLWLLFSALILIITMIAVLNIMSDKLINLRRRAWVLFNYCVAALILSALAGWPFLMVNYLFVFPLAFFITASISILKRSILFEGLVIVYFMLFIVMRIYFAI